MALLSIFFLFIIGCSSRLVAGVKYSYTSPSYPGVYPTGSSVARAFTVGEGVRARVALEELSLAGKDEVTITDGLKTGSLCTGKVLKQYHGLVDPSKEAAVIAPGSVVCIKFDGTEGNGKGFVFSVESIPVCKGTYDTVESDIVSPAFPSNYPFSQDCLWKIVVPEGQHASLKGYSFDLQPGCSKAYVSITNRQDNTGPKYCGRDLANTVVNTRGNSDVRFWSREKSFWSHGDVAWKENPGYTGFRIRFRVLGCKKSELPSTAEYGTHSNHQALYNEKDTAKYNCKDGFKYSNGEKSFTLICNNDNKWHQLVDGAWPTCVEIKCPKPDGPQYGSVAADSTAIGAKAIYSCDASFTLMGDQSRICQKDGSWSGQTPTCKSTASIGCKDMGDPKFGHVIGNGSSVNAVLFFTCNKGYILNGAANITCQSNGEWSGEKPACDIVRCPSLVAPDNGAVTDVEPTYQSVVTYSCNNGFRLVNSTNGQRECMKTGDWSGPEPFCQVITCPKPVMKYGTFKFDTLEIGGHVNYTCNRGHEIYGVETAVCQPNGTWSQGFIPLCYLVRCPHLVNLTNAEPDWSGHAFNDTVRVKCKPGFSFDEAGTQKETIRCLENKEWSRNVSQGCMYNATALISPTTQRITTSHAKTSPKETTTTTSTATKGQSTSTPMPPIVTTENNSTASSTTLLPISSTNSSVPVVFPETSPGTKAPLSTEGTRQPNTQATEGASSTPVAATTGSIVSEGTSSLSSTSTLSGKVTTHEVDTISTTDTKAPSSTKGPTSTRPETTSPKRPLTYTTVIGDISTAVMGNGTFGPGNGTIAKQHGQKDKSGTYIGIGIGCGLLLIILVMLALWYFRRSGQQNQRKRLANIDEIEHNTDNGIENQLYNLD